MLTARHGQQGHRVGPAGHRGLCHLVGHHPLGIREVLVHQGHALAEEALEGLGAHAAHGRPHGGHERVVGAGVHQGAHRRRGAVVRHLHRHHAGPRHVEAKALHRQVADALQHPLGVELGQEQLRGLVQGHQLHEALFGLGLRHLALGDVSGDAHQRHGLTRRVPHDAVPRGEPAILPVAPAPAELHVGHFPCTLARCRVHLLQPAVQVIGVHQGGEAVHVEPRHLAGIVSHDRGHRRAHIVKAPGAQVDAKDEVGRRVEHLPEALLALLEGERRLALGGDVHDDARPAARPVGLRGLLRAVEQRRAHVLPANEQPAPAALGPRRAKHDLLKAFGGLLVQGGLPQLLQVLGVHHLQDRLEGRRGAGRQADQFAGDVVDGQCRVGGAPVKDAHARGPADHRQAVLAGLQLTLGPPPLGDLGLEGQVRPGQLREALLNVLLQLGGLSAELRLLLHPVADVVGRDHDRPRPAAGVELGHQVVLDVALLALQGQGVRDDAGVFGAIVEGALTAGAQLGGGGRGQGNVGQGHAAAGGAVEAQRPLGGPVHVQDAQVAIQADDRDRTKFGGG